MKDVGLVAGPDAAEIGLAEIGDGAPAGGVDQRPERLAGHDVFAGDEMEAGDPAFVGRAHHRVGEIALGERQRRLRRRQLGAAGFERADNLVRAGRLRLRLLERDQRVVARRRRQVDLLRCDVAFGQQRNQPIERLLGEREIVARSADLLVGDRRVGALAGDVAAALVDFRLRRVDLGLGEFDAQPVGRGIDREQQVAAA